MPISPEPGSRSFGKRRAAPGAPDPDRRDSDTSTGLLAWSLRVSAVVGLLAVAGAAQLARWNRPADPTVRIAEAASPGVADPETTGALAARATRLDPCVLPAADRLRP